MMDIASKAKKITVFSGHYGSGKSNVAVNYAFCLKEHFPEVAVADLDIVNPYFRAKDAEELLEKSGIRLICSKYANSNVDIPSMPSSAYAMTQQEGLYSVIDVGGDDRGALALGRYSEEIIKTDNYEMLFVVNRFRPLTKSALQALEIMRQIEDASKMKFTAIVNNPNLGYATSEEDITSSFDYVNELSDLSGLSVKFTSVNEENYEKLQGKIKELFPIKIYIKQSFL